MQTLKTTDNGVVSVWDGPAACHCSSVQRNQVGVHHERQTFFVEGEYGKKIETVMKLQHGQLLPQRSAKEQAIRRV